MKRERGGRKLKRRAAAAGGPATALAVAEGAWYRRDWTRVLPPAVTLVAIVAIVAGVLLRGRPLPLDVAAVFAVIGGAATLLTRDEPWRGVVFMAVLAALVLAVLASG